MEATQNVKVEKDYKGLNWELTLGLTLNVSSHKLKSERCDILKFFFSRSSGIMFPFMKSFNHFKLRCGLTQKRCGELLLLYFAFFILESELISSNCLFLTNLFRANITVRTRSNSTRKLYWLFTKEIIALTTWPTSLSWLIFYPWSTVIYVLVFLPSVVSFYKKTSISLSSIAEPSLKKRFINTCRFSVFI